MLTKNRFAQVLLITLFVLLPSLTWAVNIVDEEPIARQTQTISDRDGDVTVELQWLRRPGEFALTITYYGYLTQEGPVNLYLSVNGVAREFVTLPVELPNRAQQIRILSFHPSRQRKNGPSALRQLDKLETVDYQLFRNAPYYQQFGKPRLEMKFFAHGRWDGDGNRNNENYVFEFDNPVSDIAPDHF